ncbi:MAG: zinc ribbon domain-containing protein [Bacteroidota bacterium]
MRNCLFCSTQLLPDARFCHHCGAKVKLPKVEPTEQKVIYEPRYPLNFRKLKGLPSEIKQYFVQALDRRIRETQNPRNKKDYINRLMQSDFQEIFDLRTRQLAEEAYTIHVKQTDTVPQEIDQLLAKAFDGLIDFFLVKYCKDLNEVNIPDEALQYEGKRKAEVDVQKMVVDFLDIENEDLKIYTDFVTMPLKKLQNASRNFLFPAKDEKILLIADQTVFGTCREGFALTEDALYWKAHFKDAAKVAYADIISIKKESDWLLINDLFFNVNPTVNGKIVFLLNKLKGLG